jgi:hypothetical protein
MAVTVFSRPRTFSRTAICFRASITLEVKMLLGHRVPQVSQPTHNQMAELVRISLRFPYWIIR